MLGRIKNTFIFISIVGLLSSCLNAKKGTDGLYEYDYCIVKKGEKSKIISTKNSFSADEKIVISGRVFELKSREAVCGAIVTLETENDTVKETTNNTGSFSFTVQPKKHKIRIRFIGCSDFESEIITNTNRHIEIGLGRANGFVTYGIKSKRKLTKYQLKMQALKLSRQN